MHGIIGGPPCQAYSTIGRARNESKKHEDQRIYLYKYYIEFLRKYSPDFFIFETAKYPVKPFDIDTEDVTLFSEMVKERITEDLTNGLHRKRQIGFGKLFKEIKAELALDDVEEGDLVQTGSEENSESTGREIVAFWNWERSNYFVR